MENLFRVYVKWPRTCDFIVDFFWRFDWKSWMVRFFIEHFNKLNICYQIKTLDIGVMFNGMEYEMTSRYLCKFRWNLFSKTCVITKDHRKVEKSDMYDNQTDWWFQLKYSITLILSFFIHPALYRYEILLIFLSHTLPVCVSIHFPHFRQINARIFYLRATSRIIQYFYFAFQPFVVIHMCIYFFMFRLFMCWVLWEFYWKIYAPFILNGFDYMRYVICACARAPKHHHFITCACVCEWFF